mmetsp:Transcript_26822/g.54901  ORF Transcript_26822/g.54901 Transcript_26822/m.54901 type:complete len:109 (-) Transcript_26822:242-568(-)
MFSLNVERTKERSLSRPELEEDRWRKIQASHRPLCAPKGGVCGGATVEGGRRQTPVPDVLPLPNFSRNLVAPKAVSVGGMSKRRLSLEWRDFLPPQFLFVIRENEDDG